MLELLKFDFYGIYYTIVSQAAAGCPPRKATGSTFYLLVCILKDMYPAQYLSPNADLKCLTLPILAVTVSLRAWRTLEAGIVSM
jgi:hypothetical protein